MIDFDVLNSSFLNLVSPNFISESSLQGKLFPTNQFFNTIFRDASPKDLEFTSNNQNPTFGAEIISISPLGVIGDAPSGFPASPASISADGRYIAFESDATNLVAGDSGQYRDIFVYDRQLDQMERVSVADNGVEGQGLSRSPQISADGRYVTYSSVAFNLVEGLPNNSDREYIYLYDRVEDTTELINIPLNPQSSTGRAFNPQVSIDGRFVTYVTKSDNLIPNDTNGKSDIYVYDRESGVTERVSLANDGSEANDNSHAPQISGDGRYVTFMSDASNLVAGDANIDRDIFVYDRLTDTIEMVSVSSEGVLGDNNSFGPDISADGRIVAFVSDANNLVDGPSSGHQDIYVHDRLTGVTELISIAADGTLSDGTSSGPHLSADGRFVTFYSSASVFVEGDTNNASDIFVYDRELGTMERVSVADDGSQGNGISRFPQISQDGLFVTFISEADNFAPNDTNGANDIFVVQLQAPDPSLDDLIIGTPQDDVLDGMAGNDTIYGREADDILIGGTGDDALYGEDGRDTLIGGEGADILDGGAGFDTASYEFATSGVTINLVTGGTGGEATGDVYTHINGVVGSQFNDVITGSHLYETFHGGGGNDIINGGGGVDKIYGGDGDDIQRGQDGNDALFGSTGADQLNGGAGTDQANYTNASSGVAINLVTGGTVGDAAGDTYFGIETVFGTYYDDIIIGNSGNNILIGMGGDDILDGGAGNDVLIGTTGADTLIGGDGIDTTSYINAGGGLGVVLDLDLGGTGGHADGDVFSSIEWVIGSGNDDDITGDELANRLEGRGGNDVINGEAGNDRLLGGYGNDIVNGGDGVDTIYGQDGDDILSGGADNDFFFGDAGADSHDGGTGIDSISYLPSSAGVIVNMQTGGTGGDAQGDTYTSIERLFGSGHDDSLTGSDGNDVLFGYGGDDFLTGGLGNDSLNGGAGVDGFAYDMTQDDADVIQGFTTNEIIDILGGDPNFDSFAELMAVAVDAGANTLIDFGSGNTLTIVGQNKADLSASNFTFGGVMQERLAELEKLEVIYDDAEESISDTSFVAECVESTALI